MNERTKFPEGWDDARVKPVIDHYEKQTEEEAVAEDEAAVETFRPNVHGNSERPGASGARAHREAQEGVVPAA